MRIQASQKMVAEFVGSEGRYSLQFTPHQGGWDGVVEVQIAETPMNWSVERIDRDEQDRLILSGMTTPEVWNDVFWFEAIVEPRPGQITYYGNQVVWRTDRGT